MANQETMITLPKHALREKEGIVFLPLKTWRKIEEDLEDLEMYRSQTLAKEIAERRRAKKTISLKKFLKQHSI